MADVSIRSRTANPSLRALLTLHSSYSVSKFLGLVDYLQTRSLSRKLWVVLSLPIPALIAATVPVFLPLQAPRLGPNIGFFLHASCIAFSTTYGTLIYLADTTRIPRAVFSHGEILVSSVSCAVLLSIVTALVTTYLVFPVPFLHVVGMFLWIPCLCLSLTLVLGRKLWQNPIFRDSIQMYQGAVNIQSLQLVLYPAISVLYDHVDNSFKLVIVVMFPGVKYVLKRLLYRFTLNAGECRSELIVSGVEICASLYQSMIIQTTQSVFAMGIVLGVDVMMNFVSIKLFLDHYSDQLEVPRSQFIGEAARRLHGQESIVVASSPWAVLPAPPVLNPTRKKSSSATAPDKVVIAALRITDSAERILLIEYYEVVIPVVNSIFLLVATQFPSALYNPRLVSLYHDQTQLRNALRQIWLYSFLQFLSCVVMHFFMKYRYGISAIGHLAFVLERHRFSIVGKMMSWLSVILHFTVVQYGKSLLSPPLINGNQNSHPQRQLL